MIQMYKTFSPITSLFENSRKLLYNRGDTILRAGDIPSGVYFITSGWVKAYSLCNDGETNIIMSLGPGDIFPLSWALSESLRDVTFAALDTTTVLRASRGTFVERVAKDERISKALSLSLIDRLLQLENELDNLHYRSARERVVFRLLTLAESFGQRKGNQVILNMRVPNDYIARSSNMTRETASREMSRLTRKGLIRYIKGFMVIVSEEALKAEVRQVPAPHIERTNPINH